MLQALLILLLVVAQPQTTIAEESAATNTTWTSYGAVPGGGRYSALSQINRETVQRLDVAWVHESGDVITPGDAPSGHTSYEVTPLHANGLLYYCTPLNRIFALDPASDEEVWAFDPSQHFDLTPAFPANCRGLAVWQGSEESGLCNTRVFKGDVFGRLYAVDGNTGAPCTDFGWGGYVDLNDLDNGGHPAPALMSPSAILNDLVIVGGSVIDNVSAESADGNDGTAQKISYLPAPGYRIAERSDRIDGVFHGRRDIEIEGLGADVEVGVHRIPAPVVPHTDGGRRLHLEQTHPPGRVTVPGQQRVLGRGMVRQTPGGEHVLGHGPRVLHIQVHAPVEQIKRLFQIADTDGHGAGSSGHKASDYI